MQRSFEFGFTPIGDDVDAEIFKVDCTGWAFVVVAARTLDLHYQ